MCGTVIVRTHQGDGVGSLLFFFFFSALELTGQGWFCSDMATRSHWWQKESDLGSLVGLYALKSADESFEAPKLCMTLPVGSNTDMCLSAVSESTTNEMVK